MNSARATSEASTAPEGAVRLLDERSRPDLPARYARLAAACTGLDVAIRKIRLSGMSLGRRELEAATRIRVLLAEINVLSLAAEAETMASDREGRERMQLLAALLERGTLGIRSAPLGGWAPDFSVFHGRRESCLLLVGPHWFARPYPHRGPALTSLHAGGEARRIAARFEEMWRDAHAVDGPILRVLAEAVRRVPDPAGTRAEDDQHPAPARPSSDGNHHAGPLGARRNTHQRSEGEPLT